MLALECVSVVGWVKGTVWVGGGICDRARDLRSCSQSAAQRTAELGERDGGHVQMMSFVLICEPY